MGAARGDQWRVGDHATEQWDTPTDRIEALAAHMRVLDEQPRVRRGAPSSDESKRIDRIDDRVEVLAQRVETLAEIARSASSGVVARERELSALRTELTDVRASVDAAVGELRRVDRAPVEAVQRRVAVLSDDVAVLQQGRDRLTERLDSLATSADGVRATVTAHERALGELAAEVDAVSARMDSVVAVVRQAVESLLAHVPPSQQPAASTDAIDGFAARERELVDAQRRLEDRLDELARQLERHDSRPRLVTWSHTESSDTDDDDDAVGDSGGPIASLGGGR